MPQPTQTTPHNDKMERRLLCGIIFDQSFFHQVQAQIGTDDFYDELHQATYDVIRDLVNEHVQLDIFVVSQGLFEKGAFIEQSDALDFVAGIMDQKEYGPNTVWLAERLAGLASRRHLLQAVLDTTDHVCDISEPFGDIIGKLATSLRLIGVAGDTSDGIGADYLGRIIRELKGEEMTKSSGLITGFVDLDRLIGEFENGNMIVIAARPSVGKTTLLLHILSHIAFDQHAECGLLSVETPPLSLWYNILGTRAGISPYEMRRRNVSSAEIEKLTEMNSQIDINKLHLEDCPAMNIDKLRAKAEVLHSEYGVTLLGVDYLQLIPGASSGERENSLQRVTSISQGVKDMARTLNIPVIAISQLNRASERDHRKPKLGDLRESGAIEQDADVVLLMSRIEGELNEINVNVAKNRNGPTGDVILNWTPHLMRFDNFERGYAK